MTGSEGRKANEAIAKMREDIPKVNKDTAKIWDGIALGVRYSAKEREGKRWESDGKAKEREGK